jgi:probable phosphoglycerate mutase
MNTPAEILLVRHGRAHCNDAGTIAGPNCAGLTLAGRGQATATARGLATGPLIHAIHASTTLRAWQTAEIIAEALRLDVTPEPSLRVPDPGAAEGERWEVARARWPRDPHNPTRPAAPGAEPWNAYLDRAAASLSRQFDNHPGGRRLVIGHSETASAVLQFLLGVRDLVRLKLAFDHCAITIWRKTVEWPGTESRLRRWTLVQHNGVGHLEGAYRS